MIRIKLRTEEQDRVCTGFQCPECFGVQVSEDDTPHNRKFHCQECGCQWDKNYYPETDG